MLSAGLTSHSAQKNQKTKQDLLCNFFKLFQDLLSSSEIIINLHVHQPIIIQVFVMEYDQGAL